MHRPVRLMVSGSVCLALALGAVLSSAGDALAAPNAERRVVCNAPVVRVRAKPTKASPQVGQKTEGQTVTGTKTGTWLKLDENHYIAYYYTCPAPRKTPPTQAPPKPAPPKPGPPKPAQKAKPAQGVGTPPEKRVVCNAPVVRVRAKPTKASPQVGQKTEGQTVTGTRTGTWLKLDQNHYIAYYYTCPAPKKTPPTQAPPKPVVKAPAKKTAQKAKPADDRASKTVSRSAGRPTLPTPMLQPTSTNGSNTGPFGMRLHPILKIRSLHTGVDIGNRCNSPIVAAASGTVTFTGWTNGGGNTTVISHGTLNGVKLVETKYLHQSSILVRPGQKVKRGQLIGRVGATGMSTACHLHFSTYENGKPVDPQKYIGALTSLRNY